MTKVLAGITMSVDGYITGPMTGGINPVEIAEQMGHSLQMLVSTYTHVIGNSEVDA